MYATCPRSVPEYVVDRSVDPHSMTTTECRSESAGPQGGTHRIVTFVVIP